MLSTCHVAKVMAAHHARVKAIPHAVTYAPFAAPPHVFLKSTHSILPLTRDHYDQPISVTSLNKLTPVLKGHTVFPPRATYEMSYA